MVLYRAQLLRQVMLQILPDPDVPPSLRLQGQLTHISLSAPTCKKQQSLGPSM